MNCKKSPPWIRNICTRVLFSLTVINFPRSCVCDGYYRGNKKLPAIKQRMYKKNYINITKKHIKKKSKNLIAYFFYFLYFSPETSIISYGLPHNMRESTLCAQVYRATISSRAQHYGCRRGNLVRQDIGVCMCV